MRALAGTRLSGREGTAVCGAVGQPPPAYLIAEGTAGAGAARPGTNQTPSKPWQGPCGGSEPGGSAHGHPRASPLSSRRGRGSVAGGQG